MHHCVFRLTSHPDITRFEIEDGLVRRAAPGLLGSETSISRIAIDLGAHVRSGVADPSVSTQVMLMISSEQRIDASPPHLDELVSEVAIVDGSSFADVVEVAELHQPWTGSATPGPKVSAYFRPSQGDSPEYRSRVERLGATIAGGFADSGCRLVHVDEPAESGFTTALSFWFPNPAACAEAFAQDAFDQIGDSELVDSNSLVLLETVEHLVRPNPNAWATTTGVERPETE